MGDPIDIGEYARTRGVGRSGLLRAIRERGAPVVRRGGRGPGQATLVDPAVLDAWFGLSDAATAIMLDQVAGALLDTVIRNGPNDEPIHCSIGVHRRQAAALLVFAYERVARAVLGRDAEALPAQIERLRTICETG